MTALTVVERDRLAEVEQVIERGLGTFVEVGRALVEVRDSRLYRADYGTFEAYCRERWQMNPRYANRLIESSELVEAMGPIGPTPLKESQARELSGLDPEQAADVMREAHRQTERVTASVIREVRQQIAPRPQTPPGVEEPSAPPTEPEDAEQDGTAEPPPALRPAAPVVEPDPRISEWVEGSQAVKDSGYVRSYLGAVVKAGEVAMFDAERIAALIDEGQMSSLSALAARINHFAESVRRHRSGLRVIQGGK